jgi:charged multivesicular body protein 1
MNSDQLQNLLFNMKFTSKQLEKSSKKAEKDADKEKLNIKKALEKGNMEAAKIYAENSIRKHNESLNFLRLSSKVDAAASRIDTAVKMQSVSKVMASTVKGMEKVLQAMDPMKIAAVMDQFEQQVGSMDVSLGTMESAFSNTQASTVPTSEVDALLGQIAEEHNIETRTAITGAQKARLDPVLAQQDKEMSELLGRLRDKPVGA